MKTEEVKTTITDEVTPEEEAKQEKPDKKVSKKAKRSVPAAHVHIQSTFNNTIITVTDPKGNTLTSASAGKMGFKGSKKGTAYAAQLASEKAVTSAKQTFGVSKVDVFVNGVGLGRDAAIRALINADIMVESIKEETAVAHGGVRPKKTPRG